MLEQYDVSRESLREGLRLLEVQGLISIRRGPGRRADRRVGRPGEPRAHVDALLPPRRRDLRRAVRRLGGGRDRHRRAGRPQPGPRGGPRRRWRRTGGRRPTPTPAIEEFVTAHTEFHTVLAMLTQNKVMQISLMAIGQIVTHHVVVDFDPREVAEMIEDDHRRIADAVAAGHARKARRPDGRRTSGRSWRPTSGRSAARSTTSSSGAEPLEDRPMTPARSRAARAVRPVPERRARRADAVRGMGRP